MLTDAELDAHTIVGPAPACESPLGCDEPAAAMVWVDHHCLGCDYTGFRCDEHLRRLVLETMRQIREMRQVWLNLCGRCSEVVEPGVLRDHVRWIRL